MEFLNEGFRKRGIDQVRITESPFLKSEPNGSFNSISAKCTLLELKGLDKEKMWGGYRKNIRRDVRKAQRSGITIYSEDSRECASLFYKLYLASMERNRAMAKYPLRWFEAIYEIMTQKGLGAILVAEMNHVAIAGIVLIYSPSSTHYFHNGSVYEFLKFCPNELLVHFSIERAIEKGSSFFDFMGSDPRDISLIRFKEKWGSQSVDLRTYVKDYHPLRCKIWELAKRVGNSRIGSLLLRAFRA
jgi:lipid II:glycine glycyltransferase (peptidoglycan interpeptide bridge formation enzyme)